MIPPFGATVHANSNEPATKGDKPAEWPTDTYDDGSFVLDPGNDIHPIDVDITSGVDRGYGNLASMQVASDGEHFFVRLRVNGNPYDRKVGFLSSVWLVKLAVDGMPKATIGLNGQSPHYDYVYIADEKGTNVQPMFMLQQNKVGIKFQEQEN